MRAPSLRFHDFLFFKVSAISEMAAASARMRCGTRWRTPATRWTTRTSPPKSRTRPSCASTRSWSGSTYASPVATFVPWPSAMLSVITPIRFVLVLESAPHLCCFLFFLSFSFFLKPQPYPYLCRHSGGEAWILFHCSSLTARQDMLKAKEKLRTGAFGFWDRVFDSLINRAITLSDQNYEKYAQIENIS